MSTCPLVPNFSESRVRPRGSQTTCSAPIVRASSASTPAASRPGLRSGSSCTVSVTSTVPRPSTWIPPPSLTIDDGTGSRTGPPGDGRADRPVAIPGGPLLFAPAVERPVDGTEAVVLVEDERGSDVAHPGVVEGSLDHVDVRGQVLPGDVPIRRIDDHGDRFEFGDRVGDGRPRGPRLVRVVRGRGHRGPEGRERHPHPFLRFGLARHPPGHDRVSAADTVVGSP